MYPYIQLWVITISTYFLVICISSILGMLWFLRRTARQELPKVLSIDLTLVCMISGFVGARLLHILYEAPTYYVEHPWRVFEVWNGGFVFLGGVIGGALGGYLFCRWKRLPALLVADLAVIPLSFSYSLGRVACFLNGCCYGRRCELPWAMTLNGEHRHPSQLYASFWEAIVVLILIKAEARLKTPGRLLGLWLVLHASGRMMMEYFRDDPRGDMIAGFSLGTWLSAGLFLLGAYLLAPRPSHLVPELHS